MERREALKAVTLIMGGTLVGGNALLVGCRDKSEKKHAGLFAQNDPVLLDEIGETIIPTTETPGAKAAGIGSFITMMVMDCYTQKEQKVFIDGLAQFRKKFKATYNSAFIEATLEERTAFLNQLDAEQKERHASNEGSPHYFRMIKELTLLGYFTSEAGCTQARRYIEAPGRYNGCTEYKKGDRAWAI